MESFSAIGKTGLVGNWIRSEGDYQVRADMKCTRAQGCKDEGPFC